MKKIITILFLSLIIKSSLFAQYFQGGLYNVGNKVVFKMKPTATLTTGISYMEVAFRFNPASTPPFTITPPVNILGGLKFERFAQDLLQGGYIYIRYAAVGVVVPSQPYTGGTEYELFSVTLNGAPALANIEMASDFNGSGTFSFGAVDETGTNPIVPTGDELYGTGFFKVGTENYVPLANVPVPVKFLGFDVTKRNNSAVLNWSVENESALTDKYIIEKSVNSINFLPVATIQALNNGRGSNTYTFTQDNLSAIRNSGVIYFRITQIDKDGKSVNTPIKNVRLDGKAFAVNAYPNPVKNNTKLTIDLLNESRIIISVTDAGGKQVKTMQVQGFKGPNIKDLNLSNLSNGNYMMKVQAGDEVKSLPLVKVN